MPMLVESVSETLALCELVDSAMIEAGFALALIERAAPPPPLLFSWSCEREVKATNEKTRMTR